jgi:integrase
VNTKNNVVKSANSFIAFVDSKESGAPIKRLPEFKFEEIGRRGVESIYSENDIKKLTEELEQPASDLFYTLAHTGMRVGEAIGLQNSDVILGEIPDQGRWIFKQLQDNKCSLYGYILLKSQPKDSNNPTGERVPLKGRKTIAPEYNRIIPIIDETLAEMLLERVKTGNELIFEGYSYQHFYLSLKKLAPRRDVHSLRHTFTTRFVRLCDGDPRAVEKVLGHSKSKVTEIYNHLAQELESKSKSSVPDKIKKIKI